MKNPRKPLRKGYHIITRSAMFSSSNNVSHKNSNKIVLIRIRYDSLYLSPFL